MGRAGSVVLEIAYVQLMNTNSGRSSMDSISTRALTRDLMGNAELDGVL